MRYTICRCKTYIGLYMRVFLIKPFFKVDRAGELPRAPFSE